MKFSVLMSIYKKEKAEYFNRAMQSIWDEQILKPNEIVLVQDGPLIDTLYKEIEYWKLKLKDILIIIPLEQNVGLGDALNIGLNHCKYNIIARMDTDDISLPTRFNKQIKYMENNPNIDILSSWISEFEDDENIIISERRLPEYHCDIVKFSKRRSAVNHIPVVFKKESVLKAGGYKRMILQEDYYLWIRMILNGSKFYNIQEPLAKIRSGYNQLERRSGLYYFKCELALQKEFINLGFINKLEFLQNITIRFIVRLAPSFILRKIYKLLRERF